MRFPHPIVLLGAAVIVAAVLTWTLPAGEYNRRDDVATGRRVVVAGSYHHVAAAPVGPFSAAMAIPRGFVAAAEVVAVVLFVGGAWVVVDRLGTLPVVVGLLVGVFRGRRLLMIPLVSIFFATMGALENMQEEIIPLVPVLMVLGAGVGLDGIAVVSMTAGAAMVGSAFGPTNPFQAGIALKLAQLPPLSAGGLRLTMLLVGIALWIAWTMIYAHRNGLEPTSAERRAMDREVHDVTDAGLSPRRHLFILAIIVAPMAAYVYGALRLDWGFMELAGAFLIAVLAAGLVGGLDVTGTVTMYLEGIQVMLPAALMVGLSRSISVVLEDGHVVDTILYGLVTPLARWPSSVATVLMIPAQALIHIAVPSVSGHAVLTMPLFVPAADVLGLSRQVPVLTYQTGAGLMELATPTNGALMAVLLAAGVPFHRWMRFAAGALLLLAVMGAVAALCGTLVLSLVLGSWCASARRWHGSCEHAGVGVHRFEDLRVWQAAKRQSDLVGALIKRPDFQSDQLRSQQMNASSLSVMLNVSEGFVRRRSKEMLQFFRFAAASNGEVRSCFYAGHGHGYVDDQELNELLRLNDSIGKMLRRFQDTIR